MLGDKLDLDQPWWQPGVRRLSIAVCYHLSRLPKSLHLDVQLWCHAPLGSHPPVSCCLISDVCAAHQLAVKRLYTDFFMLCPVFWAWSVHIIIMSFMLFLIFYCLLALIDVGVCKKKCIVLWNRVSGVTRDWLLGCRVAALPS